MNRDKEADQLAAEAEVKMPLRNDSEAKAQRISIIKAAIEKALEEAFTEHVWKFSDDWTEGRISALERQLRAAQGNEETVLVGLEAGGSAMVLEVPTSVIEANKRAAQGNMPAEEVAAIRERLKGIDDIP